MAYEFQKGGKTFRTEKITVDKDTGEVIKLDKNNDYSIKERKEVKKFGDNIWITTIREVKVINEQLKINLF